MKRLSLTPFLMLVPIMVCIAVGCQTPAGRSAGEVIDDATITTRVKSRLFQDSLLRGFSISVDTFQGEVTLRGSVGTQKARKKAEDLARTTTGVRKVQNFIKIE